jgi:hypothetical protein
MHEVMILKIMKKKIGFIEIRCISIMYNLIVEELLNKLG